MLHLLTVPYYPQGNGQVERFNHTIKTALRKMLDACPSAYWDDLLGDIKWGLRVIASSTHGYRPFELVFK